MVLVFRETSTLHLHAIFHKITRNTNLTISRQVKSEGDVLLFTKPLFNLISIELKQCIFDLGKVKMSVRLKKITNDK